MRALDTHAHLDFSAFDVDRPALIAELEKAGIGVINIATDAASIEVVDHLSQTYPLIWGAIGLHPTEITPTVIAQIPYMLERWRQMFEENDKLVAIGEVGLDYLHQEHASSQKAALRQFLTFAKERHLPVIFHCRQAYGDLLTLLADYPGTKGVIHCYSGDLETARDFLRLGLKLSFTANITYPKNDELREVITAIKLDDLLLETDCPFLAPQSRRGTRNDPRTILETAQLVAELKRTTTEEVLEKTTATAVELFKL